MSTHSRKIRARFLESAMLRPRSWSAHPFMGLECLESRNFLSATIDLVPDSGAGTVSEVSGHTQLSLPAGGVNVTVTVKVTPTGESFNTFQLDFDNSNDGPGQLSIGTWSPQGGFSAVDSSLSSPSNTFVAGTKIGSNITTQTTIGTFVVNVPATPGDYTITVNKASGVGSGTSISQVAIFPPSTTNVNITNFGDLVIHVEGAVVPTISINDVTVTEGNVDPPSEVILDALVRDFIGTGTTSPNQGGAVANPDFENEDFLQWRIANPETIDPGIANSTLGSDDNPTFAFSKNTASNATNFSQWFSDTPGINTNMSLPLTMSRDPNNPSLYSFVDSEFYPVDNLLFGNTFGATLPDPNNIFNRVAVPPDHNWHFTVEHHGVFTFGGGQVIRASADDDLWIFVNDKLVLDRGGVNIEIAQTVNLDDLAGSIGLTEGSVYNIDIFYAERHTEEAVLTLETNFPIFNSAEPAVKYAIFTATLSQATSVAVSASYTTSAGSALAGQDFLATTGTVTFAPGQTSRKILVPIKGDTTVESTETFSLILSNPTAATIADGTGVVTISDDDAAAAVVTVVATDPSASEEGLDPGVYTFTRTGSTASPLTVNFSLDGTATNGTDLNSTAISIVIPAGQSSVTLTRTPIQDVIVEGTETESVFLNSGAGYTVGNPSTATITVTDNDSSPLPVVSITEVLPFNEGSTNGSFVISRTGDLGAELVVNFTVGGSAFAGVDYTDIQVSATIPVGSDFVVVPIFPINDQSVEGTETIEITLSPSGNYAIGAGASDTVNLFDDDLPLVSIFASDPDAGEIGLEPGEFTIVVSGDIQEDVTVLLNFSGTAVDGTDYNELPFAVLVPFENGFATITVNPLADGLVEGAETVIVSIAASSEYGISDENSATVTIADNVAPTVTVTPFAPTGFENGFSAAAFRFFRTGSTANQLTALFTIGGTATKGTDFSDPGTQVTFSAGKSFADVFIPAINDNSAEGNETVTFTVAPNAGYTVGDPSTATVTIEDDESLATGSVQGVIYEDLNFNGKRDNGEPGRQAAQIFDDVNNNGVFDDGEPSTAGTHSDGEYDFFGLSLGQHRLRMVPLDGFAVISPSNGLIEINLTKDGQTITSKDFGISSGVPVITVVASDPTGTEGSDTARFAISRSGSTQVPLTVNYTISGTAQSGKDFKPLTGSVTLGVGFATEVVIVTPIDDSLLDPAETVILTLTSKPFYVIDQASATVTIVDNEAPPGPPNLTIAFDDSVVIPSPLLPGDTVNLKGAVNTLPGGNFDAAVRIDTYFLPIGQDAPGVNDRPTGTTTHKGKVTGGSSFAWATKNVLPDNLGPGQYHFVTVVDAGNAVTNETSESDNTDVTDALTFAWNFGNVGRSKAVTKITVEGVTYTATGITSGQIIPGDGDEPNSIDFTPDASGKASLGAKAGKNAVATVKNIVGHGNAASINFAGFTLTGGVDIDGLLSSLTMGTVEGGGVVIVLDGVDASGKATFSFTAGNVRNTSISSSIPIKSLSVLDWDDTDATPDFITAPSIAALTSKGDFAADVNATSTAGKASLGNVSVTNVLASTIRSAGNISSITAGRIVNSLILAGAAPEVNGLPTSPTAFISTTATIDKVTAKGAASGASFVASVVAAFKVGSVSLKDVTTSNGGTLFGIAADQSIGSVSRTGKAQVKNLTTIGDNNQEVDFVLRIV